MFAKACPGQQHRTATGNAFTAFSLLPNGSSPRRSRFTIRGIGCLASASFVPFVDQGIQTRDLVTLRRDFPSITGLYLRARSRSSGTTVPVLDRHFPIIEDVKGCPVFQIDNLFRFGTGSIIGKRGCRT